MAPSQKRKFEVLMYESEYRQIQAWVDKYQHLETGGDLFGLWKDDHTPVVQLVLGPGKQCRRTGVSFYQDIDYLERLGNVLTNKEGLCHIGEWHSHHKLGLLRPSGGDENTVWTNMKRYGIHRFFLFIATIGSSSYNVNIGCFLFEINPNTMRREPVLKGEIELIGNEPEDLSPFRKSVEDYLANGAESQNSPQALERFKSTGKRSSDSDFVLDHKKKKVTRKIPIDQEMEESNNVNNQEIKSENVIKDAVEKSKVSQEIESQENKLGSAQSKNDNLQHEDQQADLTDEDNKTETPKDQPQTPVSSEEKKAVSSSSDMPNIEITKVQENNDVQAEKKKVLHDKESNDVQTTEESSSKEIIPNHKIITVKPINDNSNANPPQNAQALDQNEDPGKEYTPPCGPQQRASEIRADEFKDAQENDERKQSSAKCSEIEEAKLEGETINLLEDKDLGEEDEKMASCKYFCISKKKKSGRPKREKKEKAKGKYEMEGMTKKEKKEQKRVEKEKEKE
ncbi:glutamic acid-rich protein-like, partial [Actinia tenebrosa]|uniref:Glutamic acid-rich protein-like n=1 Tax=Actinia tenebrosa TaxID=6105 RepID=A0A6P8IGZ2_ACTTE